jgi:hypothetical protein
MSSHLYQAPDRKASPAVMPVVLLLLVTSRDYIPPDLME